MSATSTSLTSVQGTGVPTCPLETMPGGVMVVAAHVSVSPYPSSNVHPKPTRRKSFTSPLMGADPVIMSRTRPPGVGMVSARGATGRKGWGQ